MNTIKKLVVALVLAVPCLLAAPAVPADPLGLAVETELEATGGRYQTITVKKGTLCIPEPCRYGLCCVITPF